MYIATLLKNAQMRAVIHRKTPFKMNENCWPEILEWQYSCPDMIRVVCAAMSTEPQDACRSGRVWSPDTSSLQLPVLLPRPSSLHPSSPVDSTAPSRSYASSGTADAGNSMSLNRRHSPECQNCNQYSTTIWLCLYSSMWNKSNNIIQ